MSVNWQDNAIKTELIALCHQFTIALLIPLVHHILVRPAFFRGLSHTWSALRTEVSFSSFFACSDTDKLYICLQIKNFISVFWKQSITVFPWMLKNPFQQMFERYTDFLFTETGWDPLNTVLIKTVFPKEEQQKKKTHKYSPWSNKLGKCWVKCN